MRNRIAGFAVVRRLAEGEAELLIWRFIRLSVGAAIGRRLFAELTSGHPGDLWLEVRESNTAARNFYKILGLRETGRRSEYYINSGEKCYCHELSFMILSQVDGRFSCWSCRTSK